MAVILPDRVLEKLRVVKAELVAEIEFTEWTPDGHLRHSKLVGLRGDKGTQDVLPARLKPERKTDRVPGAARRHPFRKMVATRYADEGRSVMHVLKAMGCSSPRCTDTTPARSGKRGKALRQFSKKFYSSSKTRAEGGVGERVKMTKKPNEIKLLRGIARSRVIIQIKD